MLDVLLARPRPRPVPRHHRLRRRRLLQRRRRDGREDRRRGLARPRAAEVRRPVVHRDLDLRGPGADGPGRRRRASGTRSRRCAQSEGVEATVIGQFVPTGRLAAEVRRPRRSPTWRWSFCTTAARRSCARRSMRRRPRASSHGRIRPTRRLHRHADSRSSARSTSPARNGSSASTTTRCKAAA